MLQQWQDENSWCIFVPMLSKGRKPPWAEPCFSITSNQFISGSLFKRLYQSSGLRTVPQLCRKVKGQLPQGAAIMRILTRCISSCCQCQELPSLICPICQHATRSRLSWIIWINYNKPLDYSWGRAGRWPLLMSYNNSLPQLFIVVLTH